MHIYRVPYRHTKLWKQTPSGLCTRREAGNTLWWLALGQLGFWSWLHLGGYDDTQCTLACWVRMKYLHLVLNPVITGIFYHFSFLYKRIAERRNSPREAGNCGFPRPCLSAAHSMCCFQIQGSVWVFLSVLLTAAPGLRQLKVSWGCRGSRVSPKVIRAILATLSF